MACRSEKALVALFYARFAIMPAIAAYKKELGLSIRDKQQEANLIARLSASAEALGIGFQRFKLLFEELILISVTLQQKCLSSGQLPKADQDLTAILRPKLAAIDREILLAISHFDMRFEALEQAFSEGLPMLSASQQKRLLQATQKAIENEMA